MDGNSDERKTESDRKTVSKNLGTIFTANEIVEDIKLNKKFKSSSENLHGTVSNSYEGPKSIASKIDSALNMAQQFVKILHEIKKELLINIKTESPDEVVDRMDCSELINPSKTVSENRDKSDFETPESAGPSWRQSFSSVDQKLLNKIDQPPSNSSTPIASPATSSNANISIAELSDMLDQVKLFHDKTNDLDDKTSNDLNAKVQKKEETNDLTWTLRHANNETGMMCELIQNSNILVRKSVLLTAETKAKSQTGLARLLLEEVFSEEALLKCSLSGGPSKIKGENGAEEKRPGLYPEAVAIILAFVREHGKTKNWTIVDDNTVKGSLRSKLVELRKAHNP